MREETPPDLCPAVITSFDDLIIIIIIIIIIEHI
jgi:hypothetical protein